MMPCTACGQPLYPLERMTLNSKVYHKQGCAKCSTCNTNLSINNFAFSGDKLFCKNHYLMNFSKSGGRYSFGAEDDTPKLTRKSVVATEPRPKSEMFRSSSVSSTPSRPTSVISRDVTPSRTPVKDSMTSRAPSSAPAKASKLAAFLETTGATESPAPRAKQAENNVNKTPLAPAPIVCTPSKAETPGVQSSVKIARDSQRTLPENKLAAFLSTGQVEPSPAKKVERNEPVRQADASADVGRAARPLSLKERIAIYSEEASNVRKPEPKAASHQDLPPLPRKESALQNQGDTKLPQSRRGSTVSQASASSLASKGSDHLRKDSANKRDPRPSVKSENRLAAFLNAVEAASPTEVQSTPKKEKADASAAQGKGAENADNANHDYSDSRRVSVRDRTEKYLNEVSKKDTEKKAAPPLPPAKPSPVAARSATKRNFSTTSSPNAVESRSHRVNTENSFGQREADDARQRPVSLKERIASYQDRASGRSPRQTSPLRKSTTPYLERNGSHKTATPSPNKKLGLRSRFSSFLKNPVHASPSDKSLDFAKGLRKICDDGNVQLSKINAKHFAEAQPEVKAVAVDLLEAYQRFVQRLEAFEEQKKKTTIIG